MPAFTDSRWFRAAFPDCVAYGFFPQRHQDLYTSWPLMHAADERLDVRDIGFATEFFADLPEAIDVTDPPSRWRHRRQSCAWAGWPCATACSSTDRPTGPQRCATAPARSRSRSGRKPRLRAADKVPGVRGIARLAEAFVVIPLVKRALPAARLPFQDPGVIAVAAGASLGGTLLRRRLRGAGGEAAAAIVGFVPALFALRGGDLAAYHGVEHKAIGAYEADDEDAADATKEHDRCGSHLVAPMLASNLAGTLLLRRVVERPGPLAGGSGRARVVGRRGRGLRLVRAPRRDARGARAQAPRLRDPAPVGTREPDERQLEVGRAALAGDPARRGGVGHSLNRVRDPRCTRSRARHTAVHAEHGRRRALAVVPGRELDHHVGADRLHGPAGVLHLAHDEADAEDEAAADQAGVVVLDRLGRRSPARTRPRPS